MRLIPFALRWPLLAIALLSSPAGSAAEELRPIALIEHASPWGSLSKRWPIDYVLLSNGEAFIRLPDGSAFRRLVLEPRRLADLMASMIRALRDVPEDAGSNPNVMDAQTIYLKLWDEESQTYRSHHGYGLICDGPAADCAAEEALSIDPRFNYWVRALLEMVETQGELWRPSLVFRLQKTTVQFPNMPLPAGTKFEGPTDGADLACVSAATDEEFRAIVSQLERETVTVSVDQVHQWRVVNWVYATPYGAIRIRDSVREPVLWGCATP
jgi:hypothetical protein